MEATSAIEAMAIDEGDGLGTFEVDAQVHADHQRVDRLADLPREVGGARLDVVPDEDVPNDGRPDGDDPGARVDGDVRLKTELVALARSDSRRVHHHGCVRR